MLSEPLIDLDAKPNFGSILHRRAASEDERSSAGFIGGIIGVVIALVIWFVIFILIPGIADEKSDLAMMAFFIMTIAGGFIGNLTAKIRFDTECQEGVIRIDEYVFEYWTRGGMKKIGMDKILGAGPDSGKRPIFQIFRLNDNPYYADIIVSETANFRYYEPVSGPALEFESTGNNGNELVREILIYHYNRRQSPEFSMTVAQLPPYSFPSEKYHLSHIIIGEKSIDEKFSCDGKTVNCVVSETEYSFPVRAVKGVLVHKVESQYGPTEYMMTLVLDPSSGWRELKLNLLGMPNGGEVEKYCRCLSTLFPE